MARKLEKECPENLSRNGQTHEKMKKEWPENWRRNGQTHEKIGEGMDIKLEKEWPDT